MSCFLMLRQDCRFLFILIRAQNIILSVYCKSSERLIPNETDGTFRTII